jgi:hypothetical protein
MGVRTTYETAGILRDLNSEEFGGDEYEPPTRLAGTNSEG